VTVRPFSLSAGPHRGCSTRRTPPFVGGGFFPLLLSVPCSATSSREIVFHAVFLGLRSVLFAAPGQVLSATIPLVFFPFSSARNPYYFFNRFLEMLRVHLPSNAW